MRSRTGIGEHARRRRHTSISRYTPNLVLPFLAADVRSRFMFSNRMKTVLQPARTALS
jgi:hypothetical protein